MDDLLKDAIADAKAVRETALANAKLALEEAFTPRIQNMLSQKIQSEIEDEDVRYSSTNLSPLFYCLLPEQFVTQISNSNQ